MPKLRARRLVGTATRFVEPCCKEISMSRQFAQAPVCKRTDVTAGSRSRRRHRPERHDTKILILAHAHGADPFTLVETSIPDLAEIFLASACRQLPSLRFESRTVPRNAVGIHTPSIEQYHEAD
jgi:hypothetical protein